MNLIVRENGCQSYVEIPEIVIFSFHLLSLFLISFKILKNKTIWKAIKIHFNLFLCFFSKFNRELTRRKRLKQSHDILMNEKGREGSSVVILLICSFLLLFFACKHLMRINYCQKGASQGWETSLAAEPESFHLPSAL